MRSVDCGFGGEETGRANARLGERMRETGRQVCVRTRVANPRTPNAGRRTPSFRRGFTLVEFLVLFGIFVILLSIFVPYLLRLRESSRRVQCATNLRQLRDALGVYAADNGHTYPRVVYDSAENPQGYTAYTGADADDPFSPSSPVQPNDVTASLWLLVRLNLVTDTAAFVCPSSGNARDPMTDSAGRKVKPGQRGNFRSAYHLSYSYSSPFSSAPGYRMDDNRKAEFALLADMSPGEPIAGGGSAGAPGGGWITEPAWNADVLALSRANSLNHGRAGQNVLFADGSVRFERTVYCGVGRESGDGGDNIYTALAPEPLNGQTPPANGNGFWAHDIGPSWEGDSYLVPTVTDRRGSAPVLRHARPATAAATQTAQAAQPATTPASAPVEARIEPATGPTTAPATQPTSQTNPPAPTTRP